MAKSVLVVDDSSAVRKALRLLFTSQEFEVCGEAENGREAIEKAQELRPDLVVMDISMPVMNGLEAARTLHRLMPTTPILMFSDYSNAFTDQEARSSGISALVSKSEHASSLIRKARTLLYHPLRDGF